MADIRSRTREIYGLEQLSGKNTLIHRRDPMVKLLSCCVYLVCLLSLDRQRVGQMSAFFLYPVVVLALAEVPFGMVLRRSLVVLPFCLMACVGNLAVERQAVMCIGGLTITAGMVSSLSILLRAMLSVAAVLTLIAVTPFPQLTAALRRLHIPASFVALLEMTYRYVGALMEEASSMWAAYQLRGGGKKLDIRHMGPFAGSLLLRSFDRAERIYGAMKCRGYGGSWHGGGKQKINSGDLIYAMAAVLTSLLFRWTDVPGWIGRMITC
ncbi:MAG: cobalt ECF transporter T component CbiQ [Oscillospiraceae bacterium]|nr:cobalt ECF transporter T component CbiQ [Oscillospiraceae bacterium]